MINSHPLSVCHSEVFHQDVAMIRGNIPTTDILFDVQWRNNHPKLYLQRMLEYTKATHPHALMIGCKLLMYPYQLNLGLKTLLNFNPLVILLSRDNKLAWYSSYKISQETQIWAVTKKQAKQHKIVFYEEDYYELVNSQDQDNKNCRDELIANHIPFIEVKYHTLNKQETMEDILSFIGLPPFGLTAVTVPQNTSDIVSRFENADEVNAFLAANNCLDWKSETT